MLRTIRTRRVLRALIIFWGRPHRRVLGLRSVRVSRPLPSRFGRIFVRLEMLRTIWTGWVLRALIIFWGRPHRRVLGLGSVRVSRPFPSRFGRILVRSRCFGRFRGVRMLRLGRVPRVVCHLRARLRSACLRLRIVRVIRLLEVTGLRSFLRVWSLTRTIRALWFISDWK